MSCFPARPARGIRKKEACKPWRLGWRITLRTAAGLSPRRPGCVNDGFAGVLSGTEQYLRMLSRRYRGTVAERCHGVSRFVGGSVYL